MTKGPQISDVALMRFMDGTHGMSAGQTHQALSATLARAYSAACSIGATDFLITIDRYSFVVRGDTVTTVIMEPRLACRFMALGRNRSPQR